jgi:hypothetical protein
MDKYNFLLFYIIYYKNSKFSTGFPSNFIPLIYGHLYRLKSTLSFYIWFQRKSTNFTLENNSIPFRSYTKLLVRTSLSISSSGYSISYMDFILRLFSIKEFEYCETIFIFVDYKILNKMVLSFELV